jgi:hypothetical protein
MIKKLLMLFSVMFLMMTSSQTFADLGSAIAKDAVYKRGHGEHPGKGKGRGPHNTPPGQCKKNPSAC